MYIRSENERDFLFVVAGVTNTPEGWLGFTPIGRAGDERTMRNDGHWAYGRCPVPAVYLLSAMRNGGSPIHYRQMIVGPAADADVRGPTDNPRDSSLAPTVTLLTQ